jgi:hypothetical protein
MSTPQTTAPAAPASTAVEILPYPAGGYTTLNLMRAVAASEVAQCFRPSTVMVCDQEGWAGSTVTGLDALVEDILTDGAPFEAVVFYHLEADPAAGRAVNALVAARGHISDHTATSLIFADGLSVDYDNEHRLVAFLI